MERKRHCYLGSLILLITTIYSVFITSKHSIKNEPRGYHVENRVEAIIPKSKSAVISKEPNIVYKERSRSENWTQPPPRISTTAQKVIVLAKTHKTASSTLATIIQRFGITNNLSFALPKLVVRFGFTPFTSDMLAIQPKHGGFHIFVNHVPFNKTSIQQVMKPKAKFVTIVRNPVTHFSSAVNFYNVAKRFNMSGNIYSPDFAFSTLLKRIEQSNHISCRYTYNGQMRDLGQFHKESDLSREVIAERIKLLDEQFDLVLLQDYFDESLILLRREMFWSFEDIVYNSMKVRERERELPRQHHIDVITKWNYVDVMLYKYFKEVLQNKIKEYGPSFGNDLRHFRRVKTEVLNLCQKKPKSEGCHDFRKDVPSYTILSIRKENETLARKLLQTKQMRRKNLTLF
ncbi:galactosylceramide sulfotransferase-like [Apostichopus japonicus]|uniref:galactosylceramide sulfotransferase-like n=1 Tax=Stichopus japonicus TaxID=307972 RepID=UPI003AB29ECD